MNNAPSAPRGPPFEIPKCIECHRTGQKQCTPVERAWPGERCERCQRHNLPCSEGVVARFPAASHHSSSQAGSSLANPQRDSVLPEALQRQQSRPRAQQNPKKAEIARAGIAKKIQNPGPPQQAQQQQPSQQRPGFQTSQSTGSDGTQLSFEPEPLRTVANQVREQVREQRSSNMRHYSLDDINAAAAASQPYRDDPSTQSIWATKRHDAQELARIQAAEERTRDMNAARAAAAANEKREQHRLTQAQQELEHANTVARERENFEREERANREKERMQAQRKLEQRRDSGFQESASRNRERDRQIEGPQLQDVPNMNRRLSAPILPKNENLPPNPPSTPPLSHRTSLARRLLPWVKNTTNNSNTSHSNEPTPDHTPTKQHELPPAHVESAHNSMDSFDEISLPAAQSLKPKRSKSPTKKRTKEEKRELKKYESKDMTGLAPIHLAAQTGDSNMLLTLIQLGADLNLMTSTGLTCLHLAVLNKHQQIIQILLEHGISIQQPTGDNVSALVLALRAKDNLGLVEMLVLAGAKVESEVLFGAVDKGEVELVKVLVRGRVDVNERDGRGLGVVHRAVMRGDTEMVRVLVSAGGDLNGIVRGA